MYIDETIIASLLVVAGTVAVLAGVAVTAIRDIKRTNAEAKTKG